MEKKNSIIPGWFPETVEADFENIVVANVAFQNINEVLLTMEKLSSNKKIWPKLERWKKILPEWLLKSFRPEFTQEELDEMFKTKQWSKEWTLINWTESYKKKVWKFVGGNINEKKVIYEVLVDGHPFSVVELLVLLEKCGAKSVRVID